MERLIAGAMSGTSADGVDVALVRVSGRGIDMTARMVAHHHRPYEPELRRRVFSLRGAELVRLAELARCTRDISMAYAAAVNEAMASAGAAASEVAAIAAHGQTMFHAPPDTMQIFDPSLVAAETGCAVVSDFRRADCAAGGQGAPLVPFADYVLFRHPKRSRLLLNVGGIANLTFIPAGAKLDDVVAFDAGPGNCVSDELVRRHSPDGPGIDEGGGEAARGRPIAAVVDAVLSDSYFTVPPPKSTDGPAMIALFDRAVRDSHTQPSLSDLLATACSITARAIARAAPRADEVFASGGGVYNRTLMARLIEEGIRPRPIRDAGADFDAGAKEAVAFALLGAATLDGVPSNVPSATGARRAVVLGSITPKP
jgi:anhydro-N-acetylmuramic acid kinase